ncbi:MAG: ankyrin repeat domain-containing protein [Thiotrichaceae bacterium]|nr:ankyrin repeat domain-containing protein [Thiotrichaceae bacterium]
MQVTFADQKWNDLINSIESDNPNFFNGLIKGKKDSKRKSKKSKKSRKKRKGKKRDKKIELSPEEIEAQSKLILDKKLLRSAHTDDYEGIKKYILAGADPNYSKKDGITALHIAAAHGNLNIVKVLATHKGDVDSKSIKNWTPLHHAARFGHLEIVRYLVGQGSSIYTVNSDGKNPYILARQIKHDHIIKYMDLWRKYHPGR